MNNKTTFTINFDEQEIQSLVSLLDVAVKATGLQGAGSAITIFQKVQEAAQKVQQNAPTVSVEEPTI